MGDGIKATLDMAQVGIALDALAGPIKNSLARRMLVEGGVFLRDKAKFASILSELPYRGPYNPISRGSHAPGTLANSIYLAFNKEGSTETYLTYSISWNSKKAWWGKLLEFKHIQTHKVYVGADGNWYTSKTPLPNPITHPARPFLGPTMDAYGDIAVQVAIERGRKELPILLGELAK
jgi:hypothetical protein